MLSLPKISFAGAGLLLVAVCGVPVVGAQEAESNRNPARTNPPAANPNAEVSRFSNFLDTHPAIEARLRENAELLSDPVFLKNHPQLANYLTAHPNLRDALAARPRWFIHRELTRPTPAPAPASPAQVADLDRFLDQHPDLARQLAQRPQLLRQAQFLNSHPALRDYVKQHPEILRPAAPRTNQPKANAPKSAAPKAAAPARPGAESTNGQP